jgi:hypothetical protein
MEFSELYKMLVGEMSAPWSDYVNPITTVQNRWNEYKAHCKKIKDFFTMYGAKIDVYLYDEEKLKRMFFISEDAPRGNINFYVLENGGIEIYEMIKGVPYEFHMSDVFKNYLLENFSFIISSSFHTKDGFGLYKRLAKDPFIKFTIIDSNTNEEITLENPEDLENYYGKDKQNFLYKITKL